MNLRDQNCEWKHYTVEEEGDHVRYDLTNKEEAVYNVHFLPEFHFLQEECAPNKTIEYTEKFSFFFFLYISLPFTVTLFLSNMQQYIIVLKMLTLFLTISITILRNRLAGPQDHRCCWKRKALRVLGSSLFAYTYSWYWQIR